MKKRLFIPCLKIVVSLSAIGVWFLKIFHDVGHLPTQSGEIVKVDYYYSMLDNISALGCEVLMYISIALLSASAISSVFSMIYEENNKVCIADKIIFAFAVALFAFSLVLASTVARGY